MIALVTFADLFVVMVSVSTVAGFVAGVILGRKL